MDWTQHFPNFALAEGSTQEPQQQGTTTNGTATAAEESALLPHARRISKEVEIADIGCGFGGLLFALAPKMPSTLLLGLEIRSSVTEFVCDKVKALRRQHEESQQQQGGPGSLTQPSSATTDATTPATQAEDVVATPIHDFQNVSCLRANTMKFLPNFFAHHQLSAIFLCFPDPHFKARKHKQRIVSTTLNSEYAYVLRPGGKVYTITDVEDLHHWMVGHFEGHESFERVGAGEETGEGDWRVAVMLGATEEGQKVERNSGRKFVAVFRRVGDPEWP